MSLAPPAVKDRFSYAGDSIYIEASGHNRHRRATIPELKAHFKGTGDTKDPPAHWYEAQLLHYGLPPSKIKGTAKMRLFEAVNNGKMAVPAHIQKLEKDLMKEWTKNEREAKKALKQPAVSGPTAKGTKRKAETTVATATNINLNLSFSVNSGGSVQIQAAEQPNKKTKTCGAATAPKATMQAVKAATNTTKKAPAAKVQRPEEDNNCCCQQDHPCQVSPGDKEKPDSKTSRKPQTARRGGARAGSRTNAAATSYSKTSPLPRPKQTARRGGVITSGTGRRAGAAGQHSPINVSHTFLKKQTARRGGSQTQGRVTSPGASFETSDGPHDEPPPPYTEYPEDDMLMGADGNSEDGGYDDYSDDDRDVMNSEDGFDDEELEEDRLEPLGLLNGRYEIESSSLDSGLILTLDGDSLWGSFDICGISGIFRLPERPWQSSSARLRFNWRGEDDQGNTFRGDDYIGDISFLGGGRIRGEILSDYDGWCDFDGHRTSGQETRSEIGAWSMRRQWDELDW